MEPSSKNRNSFNYELHHIREAVQHDIRNGSIFTFRVVVYLLLRD